MRHKFVFKCESIWFNGLLCFVVVFFGNGNHLIVERIKDLRFVSINLKRCQGKTP